ncbi:hypothetical protein AKA01nite_02190 [Alkalibacterium kapii]|uniref:Uncharacterized protein n=1 Tax=Alkalibacterium kapii TaxID=426704 RepID=A0A511AYA9_9LACT|nr:hypothetical protein AKA01nite_02190 [Alkalibacterium kapii]
MTVIPVIYILSSMDLIPAKSLCGFLIFTVSISLHIYDSQFIYHHMKQKREALIEIMLSLLTFSEENASTIEEISA